MELRSNFAVPDFIDYLCRHSPHLNDILRLSYTTRLQCSICHDSKDTTLKLYIPKYSSLVDLVDYNTKALLKDGDAVHCSKCGTNTAHSAIYEYSPDIFIIELVRVTESKSNWIKNALPIDFSVTSLKLPNFDRSYRVVGSCHHRGSLRGGHWFTKMVTSSGWYELDDLKSTNSRSQMPGQRDQTVAVLLLVSEAKFKPQ